MSSTSPLTVLVAAAITFPATAMNEWRDLWTNSDKTEEDAEIVAYFIRDRFLGGKNPLTSTDHAGLARLLKIKHASYKTPSITDQVTHSKSTR